MGMSLPVFFDSGWQGKCRMREYRSNGYGWDVNINVFLKKDICPALAVISIIRVFAKGFLINTDRCLLQVWQSFCGMGM